MAKKKHHEEHENLERWLVSYADFITLLFAFFTVLYALSQTDKKNYKEAVENIQRAFQSAGGVFPLRGSPMTPFDKAPDAGSVVPPSDRDQGRFSKQEQEVLERIEQQIKALFETTTGITPGKTDVEIVKTSEGYKIRLGEAMVYREGSDKLRRETLPFLYELGKRLMSLGFPVSLEGHSDNVERPNNAKGSQSPWQLSLSRSLNMAQFFVEGVGYPQRGLSITGLGDTEPLAENDSPEGRGRNRRVEIAIKTPDKEVQTLPW